MAFERGGWEVTGKPETLKGGDRRPVRIGCFWVFLIHQLHQMTPGPLTLDARWLIWDSKKEPFLVSSTIAAHSLDWRGPRPAFSVIFHIVPGCPSPCVRKIDQSTQARGPGALPNMQGSWCLSLWKVILQYSTRKNILGGPWV